MPPGPRARFARPASFFCHYLSVANFAPVDLSVTPLRRGRTVLGATGRNEAGGSPRARRHGVVGRPGRRASSTSMSRPPEVSDPGDDPGLGRPPAGRRRRRPEAAATRSGTTSSSERSTHRPTWPPPGPLPPTWRTWVRYREGDPVAEDSWVQAARLLVVLDVGELAHGSRPPRACASHPSLRPASTSTPPSWTRRAGPSGSYSDTHSPVAQAGLLSWTGRVWSETRDTAGQRRRPGRLPPHLSRGPTRPCNRPCGPGCAASPRPRRHRWSRAGCRGRSATVQCSSMYPMPPWNCTAGVGHLALQA